MTAGAGISHSERSTSDSDILHGVQLWVALPEHARFTAKGFEHYAPGVTRGEHWSAKVFLGSFLGDRSPVATHTPLLGAELNIDGDSTFEFDVDARFEHGTLVDSGSPCIEGVSTPSGHLAYLGPGASTIAITTGPEPARLLVIGGPPFGEQIVMWWNFVGRSHDEIVQFRDAWHDEIAGHPALPRPRYGLPDGDPEQPLAAPALPPGTLRPRG